jgi:hypothetical protein
MKQIFIILSGLFLSACVGGGMSLTKSLPANFKDYGHAIVKASDGHPVRDNETSRRFEVRAGDCSSNTGWSDCDNDRERHELKSTIMRGEKWVHWSIFLPEDYPNIYPVKVALAQFHQKKGHVVWMFQNHDGGYWVDNQTTGTTVHTRQILTDEDMRGKWNDILVHVNWASTDKGFFRVYINGDSKPAYEWDGKTRSSGKTVYYKLGIYRTHVSRLPGDVPTQIVYYDNVSAASNCSSATTRFDCAAITGE